VSSWYCLLRGLYSSKAGSRCADIVRAYDGTVDGGDEVEATDEAEGTFEVAKLAGRGVMKGRNTKVPRSRAYAS